MPFSVFIAISHSGYGIYHVTAFRINSPATTGYGSVSIATPFAVTPFLGDITPFSKPGRRFGNYVASLGRSFAVVNIVGSRPAFRVSSVVIRSVFTNVISIQT